MTRFKAILIAILISAIFVSALLVPRDSDARRPKRCEVRSDVGHACMVVNDALYSGFDSEYKAGCTLADALWRSERGSDYCGAQNNEQIILFQPAVPYPDGTTNYRSAYETAVQNISRSYETEVNEPQSITLEEDQKIVLWGLIAPWLKGCSPFREEDYKDSNFYCWDSIDTIDPASTANQKNYRPVVKIKVPSRESGNAAITITNGTLVLRNMNLKIVCNDPSGYCGPAFKLINAKLVIIDSKFDVGHGVSTLFDIRDYNEGVFTDNVSFTETGSRPDQMSYIKSYAGITFMTTKSKQVLPLNFINAEFDLWPDAFPGLDEALSWKGQLRFFFTQGVHSIICKNVIGSGECIIDNSEGKLKYSELCADSTDSSDSETGTVSACLTGEVLLLNKNTKKVTGVNFEKKGDLFSFPIPESKNYAMTNMGQEILVMSSCPDGSRPSVLEDGSLRCTPPEGGTFDPETGETTCTIEWTVYDPTTNSCVCTPQNTELRDGECTPIDGYEWQNPDDKHTGALPECKGEAVPHLNLDGTTRCVCPNPDEPFLDWSPSGISRCLATDPDLPASSTSTSPADDTSDSGSETSAVDEDPIIDVMERSDDISDEEQNCLDNNGSWVQDGLIGRCIPRDDDMLGTSTEDGSSGCSLVTHTADGSFATWMILLGMPLLSLIRARRRKSR